MDEVTLKQRAHNQAVSAPLPTSIAFRHPGYDDPEDILFTLPRLDSSPQAEAVPGVHHGTALLACQIVANNSFNGYMTTDRAGTNRVSVALDGLLLDDDYWFIVPGQVGGPNASDDCVYPVVPRFEEWQFPHSHMASLIWDPKDDVDTELHNGVSGHEPTLPISATSAMPSSGPFAPPPPRPMKRCILSNNSYAMQKAHIVPTAQSKWFQANSMRRYGDNQHFIHTERNQVFVRHDLHKLWDDYVFALVPKRSTFVVHVLGIPNSAANEFASEWHNMPVQKGALHNVDKAFLFAKYAQAVFMLFKPFIAFSAVPRYLTTFQARADDPRFPAETKTAWVSVSALSQQYSGGGSRSASTSAGRRKRSRSQTSGPNEADEAEDTHQGRLWSSLFAQEEDDEDWVVGQPLNEWEGDERGRPRKRRQRHDRSEHTVDTLPSLTDTCISAAGDDDLDHSGILPLAGPLSIDTSKDGAAVEGAVPYYGCEDQDA